jgi:hypothetical protein
MCIICQGLYRIYMPREKRSTGYLVDDMRDTETATLQALMSSISCSHTGHRRLLCRTSSGLESVQHNKQNVEEEVPDESYTTCTI